MKLGSKVASPVIVNVLRHEGLLESGPETSLAEFKIRLADEREIELVTPPRVTISLLEDLELELEGIKAKFKWVGIPKVVDRVEKEERFLSDRKGYVRLLQLTRNRFGVQMVDSLSGSINVGEIKSDVAVDLASLTRPQSFEQSLNPPSPSITIPERSRIRRTPRRELSDSDASMVFPMAAARAPRAAAEIPEPVGSAPCTEEEWVTAYPRIEANPWSVVQRSPIRVEVSLDLSPVIENVGQAKLPRGRHKLRVHVLLGRQSAWEGLEFDSNEGTVASAVFNKLVAPDIAETQASPNADRDFVPIVVNFYLNNRWCGEGRRNIEIRARSDVVPSEVIRTAKESPWVIFLRPGPGAVPPDLLVRIHSLGLTNYRFVLVSPHMNFEIMEGESVVSLGVEAQSFAKKRLTFFEGPGGKLRDELTAKEVDQVKSRLEEIYDFAPEVFKEGYWKLMRLVDRSSKIKGNPGPKLETIQFVSDEPYIPWDLMKPRGELEGEKGQILSIRHAVGRWSAAKQCHIRSQLIVKSMVVFASGYDDAQGYAPLLWAKEEGRFLSCSPYGAKALALTEANVSNLFNAGGAQCVHFACHGAMDVAIPSNSTIRLSGNQDLTTDQVDREGARDGLGKDRPLIFLNACQVASQGRWVAIVTGWPQAFMNIGATACIAPLLNIYDETAKVVAEKFYKRAFEEGASLGDALRGIKGEWEVERSLTYLCYALYGDPAAKVVWRPLPSLA
jgi:hypothetical protein